MTFTLTYVTAIIDIQTDKKGVRNSQKRFENFKKLACQNIPIVLFLDSSHFPFLTEDLLQNSNIHIVPIEFKDLTIWKLSQEVSEITLPEHRNLEKDTLEYMILINAKSEFVSKAVHINPFNTKHFAWIDFSIPYIFKEEEKTIQSLVELSRKQFKEHFFAAPGCWSKGRYFENVWNAVNWRFNGGFFIGDAASIEFLYSLYLKNFLPKLKEKKRMLWEVNFWHIFEMENPSWEITWWYGGHDDSMMIAPVSIYL